MDIFSELDEDLQRVVLSFIPTKMIKITDAFVEWWNNEYLDRYNLDSKFLGMKMSKDHLVKENLAIKVWAKTEQRGIYCKNFIFGTKDNMRKEWFEYNEKMRKEYENNNEEWEDDFWNDYIYGTFEENEIIYHVADDWKQHLDIFAHHV